MKKTRDGYARPSHIFFTIIHSFSLSSKFRILELGMGLEEGRRVWGRAT